MEILYCSIHYIRWLMTENCDFFLYGPILCSGFHKCLTAALLFQTIITLTWLLYLVYYLSRILFLGDVYNGQSFHGS